MSRPKRCVECKSKSTKIEVGFDICTPCREYRKFLNWYTDHKEGRIVRDTRRKRSSQSQATAAV